MHPILLKIGPVVIYSWGLMVALGSLAGILLAINSSGKYNIPSEKVIDLALYSILSGLIGARFFYVILFFNEFKSNAWQIIRIQDGGLVFFGAVLGGIICFLIFSRINKLSIMTLLDLATPSVLLGYTIGRWGCFLNGCCYGVVTTQPWGVKFPHLIGLHYPTQIYASFIGLIMLLILLYRRKKQIFSGQIFLEGIILYAFYRFSIEFIRVNPKYFILTAAQWTSLALFILGIAYYWKTIKSNRAA
jgi:phosphatidylglycerol:prolipoprotein diacylglycerol transferase